METSLQEIQQPIIAILAMDGEEKNFRGNRENFIDIIQAGKDRGVFVYVTTARELNLGSRRIIGYTYNPDGGVWTRGLVPLANVVYNRIPHREDELLPEVQRKIDECLRHPQIRLYNPAFFNKWTLFEWLMKSKKTRKYIPATRKLNNKLDLSKLLKKHSLLYLKPEKGKAGKGIMRVKRDLSKRLKYQLSIQESRKSETFKYANLTELWNKIIEFKDSEEYIAQQGIVLASNNRRPFDLRVLVQKNSRGVWLVTGIGARIAGMLSITTHVPRGGSIDDPEKLLAISFGDFAAMRIMRRARIAALTICKQIERGSGHVLGEMSMDLGVDATGHVWFFEANSKPMKFDEPHIREKSLKRLVYYCKYLAKQRKPKPGGYKIAR